jgi:hypothetical protein
MSPGQNARPSGSPGERAHVTASATRPGRCPAGGVGRVRCPFMSCPGRGVPYLRHRLAGLGEGGAACARESGGQRDHACPLRSGPSRLRKVRPPKGLGRFRSHVANVATKTRASPPPRETIPTPGASSPRAVDQATSGLTRCRPPRGAASAAVPGRAPAPTVRRRAADGQPTPWPRETMLSQPSLLAIAVAKSAPPQGSTATAGCRSQGQVRQRRQVRERVKGTL